MPPPAFTPTSQALYDATRKRWVLWFNYIANGTFSLSFYAVAVAPSPDGPYTIVNPRVALLHDDVGDFNLMQDGAAAYVIYTSLITAPAPNHRMSVELLTPDFTDSARAGSSGFFGDSFVEAPALFRRGAVYYAIFGRCVLFSPVMGLPCVLREHALFPRVTRRRLVPHEHVMPLTRDATAPLALRVSMRCIAHPCAQPTPEPPHAAAAATASRVPRWSCTRRRCHSGHGRRRAPSTRHVRCAQRLTPSAGGSP